MKIAKTEIADKRLFKKVKEFKYRVHCVECGLCGAIRVEAHEMARVIHSFIDHSENADDEINVFGESFLGQIIESAPAEFKSFEEFEKWEAANERPTYHFLDDDGYESKMYGSYDELVIFHNPTCDCFGKEKIKNRIVVGY